MIVPGSEAAGGGSGAAAVLVRGEALLTIPVRAEALPVRVGDAVVSVRGAVVGLPRGCDLDVRTVAA